MKLEKKLSIIAKNYDKRNVLQKKINEYFANFVVENIVVENINKISDIGCGTGDFTRHLMQIFPNSQIDCFDISSDMLNLAKKNLKNDKINFTQSDAMSVDLSGYQASFSSMALHMLFDKIGDFFERNKKNVFFTSIPIKDSLSYIKNIFKNHEMSYKIIDFPSIEILEKHHDFYEIVDFKMKINFKDALKNIKNTGFNKFDRIEVGKMLKILKKYAKSDVILNYKIFFGMHFDI